MGQAAIIVLLALGCGGRARGDGPSSSDSPSAAGSGPLSGNAGKTGGEGAGPAGGGASGVGAAGSAGKGGLDSGVHATEVTFDDEQPTDGRPIAPTAAAIFWGSSSTGWRIGNWFVTTDTDKTRDVGLSIIEPPRGASKQARRVKGQDQPRGAVLWLQLDHPLDRVVMLKAYSGVTFWARLESATGALVVSLNGGAHPPGSFEDRESLPSVPLTVGDSWQQFTLPFDAFGAEEPSASSIEFLVGQGGEAYDLWIDDLALTCSGTCP